MRSTHEIDGRKLGDELPPAAVEALALQQAHAVEEGDGEEGRGRQLVGQDLEADGAERAGGQHAVQVAVPVVVQGALAQSDREHAA